MRRHPFSLFFGLEVGLNNRKDNRDNLCKTAIGGRSEPLIGKTHSLTLCDDSSTQNEKNTALTLALACGTAIFGAVAAFSHGRRPLETISWCFVPVLVACAN
jgi:hypothetical protein